MVIRSPDASPLHAFWLFIDRMESYFPAALSPSTTTLLFFCSRLAGRGSHFQSEDWALNLFFLTPPTIECKTELE